MEPTSADASQPNTLASFVYTRLMGMEIRLGSTLQQTKEMSTSVCSESTSVRTGHLERLAMTTVSISCQELQSQRQLPRGLPLQSCPLSGSENTACLQELICWGRGWRIPIQWMRFLRAWSDREEEQAMTISHPTHFLVCIHQRRKFTARLKISESTCMTRRLRFEVVSELFYQFCYLKRVLLPY